MRHSIANGQQQGRFYVDGWHSRIKTDQAAQKNSEKQHQNPLQSTIQNSDLKHRSRLIILHVYNLSNIYNLCMAKALHVGIGC